MKKKQTEEDYFHIAYKLTNKFVTNEVYPTKHDYVQNSMVKMLATPDKFTEYPIQSLCYDMKNTFHRIFIKKWNKHHISLDDVITSSGMEDDIHTKLELQRFFKWLPKDKLTGIFKMKMEGYTMKEIGDKYNYSRQHIHNIMNMVIDKYHNEVLK